MLTAGAREDTEPGSLRAAIYRLPAAAPHAGLGRGTGQHARRPPPYQQALPARAAGVQLGRTERGKRTVLRGAADPAPAPRLACEASPVLAVFL